MRLVEQHIIQKSNKFFIEVDVICFKSKNLYNYANYIIRNEYLKTSKDKEEGKREHAHWIRYTEIQKAFQKEKQFDYTQLPAKVSQQVLMSLDKSWKGYFSAIKDYAKNKSKYKGEPRFPKYKHKTKGRNLVTYTIQAISEVELRKGFVKLSKTSIKIPTQQTNIQQARIVPKAGHYVIEIIYEKEVNDLQLDKNNIAGMDIGVNNLVAITSNQKGVRPLLINGKPLKSMNQFYNKKRAVLQSFVQNKSSNRLVKLTNKRNRKIKDYMHKASKIAVEHLVKNDIGTVVVGKNKWWKDKVNMGTKSNQNFVFIPHETMFIRMLTYKCELVGINVITNEEHYTSMCSFIDFESIEKHDKYLGKRKKRGLFLSKDKIKINADCNGSGNIIRKVFPNAFAEGIEGVVVRPRRVAPLLN